MVDFVPDDVLDERVPAGDAWSFGRRVAGVDDRQATVVRIDHPVVGDVAAHEHVTPGGRSGCDSRFAGARRDGNRCGRTPGVGASPSPSGWNRSITRSTRGRPEPAKAPMRPPAPWFETTGWTSKAGAHRTSISATARWHQNRGSVRPAAFRGTGTRVPSGHGVPRKCEPTFVASGRSRCITNVSIHPRLVWYCWCCRVHLKSRTTSSIGISWYAALASRIKRSLKRCHPPERGYRRVEVVKKGSLTIPWVMVVRGVSGCDRQGRAGRGR